MNIAMFFIGTLIFTTYIVGWIYYSARKNREENYPTYYDKHGMDMDGMGNFSRFPTERQVKRVTRKGYKKVKKVS